MIRPIYSSLMSRLPDTLLRRIQLLSLLLVSPMVLMLARNAILADAATIWTDVLLALFVPALLAC